MSVAPLHPPDPQWYNFNDSSVSKIEVEDVRRAWGGPWADASQGTNSSSGRRFSYRAASSYGTNAYMLMYRRVDPERNARFPGDSEVPEYLRQVIRDEEDRAARDQAEREERRNAITVRCVSGPCRGGMP
jgi:ubiquitin carboxyl-terminal hydrolase 47